jgi:uncharacterized protein (DUF1499 family)
MSTLAKVGLVGVGLVVVVFVLTRLNVFSGKRPPNLGVTDGDLAPCPDSPNCVSTQAEDDDHRMAPIPYTGSPEAAKGRLVSIVTSMPRTRVVEETPQYLYVEFRTAIMRFADDVEFYIDEAAGVIHFRSASRLGYSDMGVNRRRMEEVRRAFAASH